MNRLRFYEMAILSPQRRDKENFHLIVAVLKLSHIKKWKDTANNEKVDENGFEMNVGR